MENLKGTALKYSLPKEFNSALKAKCPRCRKGDMFDGSLLSLRASKMKTNCPHCNLKFEKEPGYFYVSMFISYAFSVAQLIGSCLLTYILTGNEENPWLYVIVALSVIVLFTPFNYRYSRVALMYWLTPQYRFDPEWYLGIKKTNS